VLQLLEPGLSPWGFLKDKAPNLRAEIVFPTTLLTILFAGSIAKNLGQTNDH
jgi:hypothetical protein